MRDLFARQKLIVSSDQKMALSAEGAKLDPQPIPPKTLSPVSEVASWPGYVRPGELLHLLGEALTPQLAGSDFWVAAQWALYRYFWAFSGASSKHPLRLSSAAARLVDHHRTLASEQLGIACSLHVGLWIIGERHSDPAPEWVDADMALATGQLAGAGLGLAAMAASRRMRPDYFLIAIDSRTGDDQVYALECKGTHDSSYWKRQMKKGASQVGGVTVNSQAPPSFVISTVLSEQAIEVRVLDPPGGDEWAGLPDFTEEEGVIGKKQVVERSGDEVSFQVNEMPRFRADLSQIADARRLAFAGQFAAALEALPSRVGRGRGVGAETGNAQLEKIDTQFGPVSATRARLPLNEHVLEISKGILSEELDDLRALDPQERRARRAERGRGKGIARDSELASLGSMRLLEGQQGFESLRNNGTFLGVRLA